MKNVDTCLLRKYYTSLTSVINLGNGGLGEIVAVLNSLVLALRAAVEVTSETDGTGEHWDNLEQLCTCAATWCTENTSCVSNLNCKKRNLKYTLALDKLLTIGR
jgi:hypothetical protein